MTTEPAFREPAARPPALAWLLLAVLPVIVNGYLGYRYVDGLRHGSLPGLSVLVFAVPGLGLVLAAIIVGVAGISRRDAYGGMLARRWFAIAVLLAAGFGAGASIIPVREALYPGPVVVELPPKIGSIVLVLDDPTWLASADPSTVGECPLEPSGDVRFVTHEQLGTLQAKPLSATFDPGDRPFGSGEAQLSLVVFAGAAMAAPPGARIAEVSGDGYITWLGVVSITEIAADGTTGRATFVDLPVVGAPPSSWPRSLTGELSWTCS